MTKSLAMQRRFQELEHAIHQQITETRLHQAEFLRMNNRFDKLEGWILTTMAVCKGTSQSVLELHQETNDNLFGMQQEAAIHVCKLRTAFAEMAQIIHSWPTIETQQTLPTHQQTASKIE